MQRVLSTLLERWSKRHPESSKRGAERPNESPNNGLQEQEIAKEQVARNDIDTSVMDEAQRLWATRRVAEAAAVSFMQEAPDFNAEETLHVWSLPFSKSAAEEQRVTAIAV